MKRKVLHFFLDDVNKAIEFEKALAVLKVKAKDENKAFQDAIIEALLDYTNRYVEKRKKDGTHND